MGAAEKSAGAAIVVTTEENLRALIGDAVRQALGTGEASATYLTLDQAAELLSASTRSVRTWVRSAGLPAIRLGGEYRFKRSEIVRWLEERAITPGAHVTRQVSRLRSAK